MLDLHRLGMVATCARGLEGVLSRELHALGAAGVEEGRGAVTFAGAEDLLCRANLELRTAMRVVVTAAEGPVAGREQLYGLVAELPWESLVGPSATLAVEAVGRHPAFPDQRFAALVVKDAVVDRVRRRRGHRPDVDRADPDLRIHLHLRPGRAAVGLDSSGEPLSHRGYRPRGGPAPLAETLAAGMLLLAGYDGSQPLLDPMCGTGTIAAEAALIATRSAPGSRRSFAFERWSFLSPSLLDRGRSRSADGRRPAPATILACDNDPRAVDATRRNLVEAGVADAVEVLRRDVRELEAAPGSLVVSNPPYGHRMGEPGELRDLYRTLGEALRRGAAGSTAWLLVGDPGLSRALGLRASRRIPLFNGPLECRFLRYDIREAGPGHTG